MSSLAFCRVPVLAYHKLGRPSELGVNVVLSRAFERQMRLLAEYGYQSLHPDQLVQAFDDPTKLPACAVLLTFDDGYTSFYEIAYPILKRFGFTATIFMTVGFAGRVNHWEVPLAWRRSRHLSWEQLRDVAEEGFCIGAHGWHHRFLTHTADLDRELSQARTELERRLDVPVEYLAYPYGAWNPNVARWASEAGYRAAFTYSPRSHLNHPYAIPRIGIYLQDTLWAFKAKLGILGSVAFQIECQQHRLINAFTYANLLRPCYWVSTHA